MIGRGLLMDPFLPSTIKGIHLTRGEKINKLKAFHDGTLIQNINGKTDEKYLNPPLNNTKKQPIIS